MIRNPGTLNIRHTSTSKKKYSWPFFKTAVCQWHGKSVGYQAISLPQLSSMISEWLEAYGISVVTTFRRVHLNLKEQPSIPYDLMCLFQQICMFYYPCTPRADKTSSYQRVKHLRVACQEAHNNSLVQQSVKKALSSRKATETVVGNNWYLQTKVSDHSFMH